MTLLPACLNYAWMLSCRGELRAYHRATRDVENAQWKLLREILQRNGATEYGRLHGFGSIRDAREFQDRVPTADYEQLQPWIQRIAAGERNVLTRDPVRLLEPTSGTSGGEKLIPYSAPLRRQFQRGVSAWIADLFTHRLAVRRGRAYWSLSPPLGPKRHSLGGIPIGFDDDSAYLSGVQRRLVERVLVTPPASSRMADLEGLRYDTLRCLLAAADLSLISVWSPTFLTALLAPLPEWADRICFDLEHESRQGARRAAELRAIFHGASNLAEQLQQIWPHLALISCWTDSAAERFVPSLAALFPQIEIQPKGLLATEGFVSFPLVGRPGAALALRSHFFEFEPASAESASPRLAHELEPGGHYRVLLTTGGGLYRYPLRDEIEVVGFHQQCPLLRFVGKVDQVSDLVGEKLSATHVNLALDQALHSCGLAPSFAMLAPIDGPPPRYRLYLELATPLDDESLSTLVADLQQRLETNPHYRYAVQWRQLSQVEICLLAGRGGAAWEVYERQRLAQGQRMGNVKPTALDGWTGWDEAFRPSFDRTQTA